jgi:hypothetical protein
LKAALHHVVHARLAPLSALSSSHLAPAEGAFAEARAGGGSIGGGNGDGGGGRLETKGGANTNAGTAMGGGRVILQKSQSSHAHRGQWLDENTALHHWAQEGSHLVPAGEAARKTCAVLDDGGGAEASPVETAIPAAATPAIELYST